MKRVLNSIGNASEKIGEAFDKNFTNKEEMLEKVNEVQKILIEAKQAVLTAEARGNWLQRSWRPITGLAFTLIVVYAKLIAPITHLPQVELEPDFYDLLRLVLGGYVVGRTVEKSVNGVRSIMGRRNGKDS